MLAAGSARSGTGGGGGSSGQPIRRVSWSGLTQTDLTSIVDVRPTSTSEDVVPVVVSFDPPRTVALYFAARLGGYTGNVTVTGVIAGGPQIAVVPCPTTDDETITGTTLAFDSVSEIKIDAQADTNSEWAAGVGNGVALPETDEPWEDVTGYGVMVAQQRGDPPLAEAPGLGMGAILGPATSPPWGIFQATQDAKLGVLSGTGPENDRLTIAYIGVSA